MVKVNGTDLDVAGTTILEYVTVNKYVIEYIAVERNGEIVPKASYGEEIMEDGDVIEVVSFVGGG